MIRYTDAADTGVPAVPNVTTSPDPANDHEELVLSHRLD
jgi:hypothetical protein